MPTLHETQPTLRSVVQAEIEAESWDLDEIGRQLSAGDRPMCRRHLHNLIRNNGLPTFLTPGGRRRGYPHLSGHGCAIAYPGR